MVDVKYGPENIKNGKTQLLVSQNEQSYWVATRGVELLDYHCEFEIAYFNVSLVFENFFWGDNMRMYENSYEHALMPIVTLKVDLLKQGEEDGKYTVDI